MAGPCTVLWFCCCMGMSALSTNGRRMLSLMTHSKMEPMKRFQNSELAQLEYSIGFQIVNLLCCFNLFVLGGPPAILRTSGPQASTQLGLSPGRSPTTLANQQPSSLPSGRGGWRVAGEAGNSCRQKNKWVAVGKNITELKSDE